MWWSIQHFCLKLTPSTQYLTPRLFSFWRWELQEVLDSENPRASVSTYLSTKMFWCIEIPNWHIFSCKFNFRHMFCMWAVMKNDHVLRNNFGNSDNKKFQGSSAFLNVHIAKRHRSEVIMIIIVILLQQSLNSCCATVLPVSVLSWWKENGDSIYYVSE